MNTILISGIAQSIAGLCTLVLPLATSFSLLAIYAVMFGSSIGLVLKSIYEHFNLLLIELYLFLLVFI